MDYKTIEGKQVLAFLPAWDGRYYVNYPEHQPDERMGGKVGLKNLIKSTQSRCESCSYVWWSKSFKFKFLEEKNMTDAGLKTPYGHSRLQNWLDWNTDLNIETMGLIMNFGHPSIESI